MFKMVSVKTKCLYCNFRDPYPEMVVFHMMRRHLPIVKKNLKNIKDVSANKTLGDTGTTEDSIFKQELHETIVKVENGPEVKDRNLNGEMSDCFFCSFKDPFPEAVVLHMISVHLIAVKKKLNYIIDISVNKIRGETLTASDCDWEDDEYSANSLFAGDFLQQSCENDGIQNFKSEINESMIKQENLSDYGDFDYDGEEMGDYDGDHTDLKPLKEKKLRLDEDGNPMIETKVRKKKDKLLIEKKLRIDKDGNLIKETRGRKKKERPFKEKKAKIKTENEGEPIKKKKKRVGKGNVNPKICQHCGAWFPNDYRAAEHICAMKDSNADPISDIKPAKELEHSKICKFCHPHEPGKKRKGFHDCSMCNFKGVQYSLQRHFDKIHLGGRKMETCQLCGKVTKDLAMHKRNAHQQRNIYKCRYCDFRSHRLYTTQYHIGRRHPEMGLVTCEFDKFNNCRFSAYSQRQLERHDFYYHKKIEPIPEHLPKAEKAFIKNGIPIFQNFDTVTDLPEGTTIHSCPYKPCQFQSLQVNGLNAHKRVNHETFDIEKFMNESI